jgi:hypothetical protein
MKKLLTAMAMGACLSFGVAHAADPAPAAAKPGSKLGACSKEAAGKGLKGDERNKYLSDCNKGLTTAATPAKPGSKLGACSKEAKEKGLKGDERNKYLSTCNKA